MPPVSSRSAEIYNREKAAVISEIRAQIKVIVVGLVGDRDPAVPAHQAIPIALERAAEDGAASRVEQRTDAGRA
jgi:hypothetical protein